MLRIILLLNALCIIVTLQKENESDDDDLGADLIAGLRNDANLDLSVDAEYEDLRADLLAYNTALASLTSEMEPKTRRSMGTTPCWNLGGICIKYELCIGPRFLTQVPGCKGKLNVCCFGWNTYQTRDIRDKGISGIMMPWGHQNEIGGKGIIMIDKGAKKRRKKKKKQEEIKIVEEKNPDDAYHWK